MINKGSQQIGLQLTEIQASVKDKIQNSEKKIQQSEFNNQEDEFILDRFPAKINLALDHAKAKQVARFDISTKTGKERDVCDCCGFGIYNEHIPICEDHNKLAFLGPGVPMYYSFLIGCLYLQIVAFLVFGLANLYLNLQGDDCQDEYVKNECQKTIISQFSFANKKNDKDQLELQSWINLGTIIILVISLHIYRRSVRIKQIIYDSELISPSDFTVQLQHLPPNVTKDEIKQMIRQLWENTICENDQHKKLLNFETQVVRNICIAYDLTEYYTLINDKNQNHLKIRQAKYYFSKKQKYPNNITEEQFQDMVKMQDIYKKKLENLAEKVEKEDNSMKTSSVAFVSFDSEEINDLFVNTQDYSWLILNLKRLQMCLGSNPKGVLLMRNKIIKCDRAPEPSDVLWQNCGATNAQKNCKRFITFLVTTVMLLICFVIIFLLNDYQLQQNEKYEEEGDKSQEGRAIQLGISFLVSFFIVFVNGCLTIAIKRFAMSELRSTETHLNKSIGSKLSYAQFANTALITLLANLFINEQDLWSSGGLITDVFNIIWIQAIIFPLNNFFSIFKLLRICKRRQIKNKIEKEGESCIITQGEANFWFEGNPLDLSKNYAHLIKLVWMAAFYAPLLPITFLISCFGLIFCYWTDKYLLLNRNARPKLLSEDLNASMIEKLEYFPLAMAIGNLFFQNLMDVETQFIADYIAIGFSAFNFIIPSSAVNRFLCKISTTKSKNHQVTYDKAKITFQMDYDRCNPITATKAMREWVEFIEKYGDEDQKMKMNKFIGQVSQIKNQGIKLMQGFGRGYQGGQGFMQQFIQAPQPINPMQQFQQQQGQHMYGGGYLNQQQFQPSQYYQPVQQQAQFSQQQQFQPSQQMQQPMQAQHVQPINPLYNMQSPPQQPIQSPPQQIMQSPPQTTMQYPNLGPPTQQTQQYQGGIQNMQNQQHSQQQYYPQQLNQYPQQQSQYQYQQQTQNTNQNIVPMQQQQNSQQYNQQNFQYQQPVQQYQQPNGNGIVQTQSVYKQGP